MIELPLEIQPLRSALQDGVPSALRDKRSSIFSHDTVTIVSNLQDYMAMLFELDNKNSVFSDTVPWKIGGKSVPSRDKWTVQDEIVIASVVLFLNYQKLSAAATAKLLVDPELPPDETVWKVSNQWLRQALTLVKFLVNSGIYNNEIETLSLDFLNFLVHLCESSIQLNLLIKANYTKISTIIRNVWDFDVDTKNSSIYLKVCVFINDELSICEHLIEGMASHKNLLEYVRIHRAYIKIYTAYYKALEYYEQDKIGVSLGIINYIKSNLLKNDEADAEDSKKLKSKLMSKFGKSSLNEKDLIKQITSKKDYKLSKRYEKFLSENCLADLINFVKLINLINLKLLKENDNIKYQAVVSNNEVHSFLSDQPLGRKIPLTVEETPSFLKNSSAKERYIGSGSYY